MNSKNKKTLAMTLVLAMVMIFTLAGCGGGDDKNAGGNGALSEKDYVAKVTELYKSAETAATDGMGQVDQTDPQKMIDGLNKVIEDVTPIYEEMGALQAPEKYADQQAKIKAGCDAAVELLKLSADMTDMAVKAQAGEVDQEEAQTKLQELTSKMTDLQAASTEFQTAVDEVMADAE